MEGDFRIGQWLVQPTLNSISDHESSKRVEPKMMQVLVHLAAHAGQVVSKEQLMGAAWPDTFVTDDVLLRCISELRKALSNDPREPRFIKHVDDLPLAIDFGQVRVIDVVGGDGFGRCYAAGHIQDSHLTLQPAFPI